MKTIIMAFGGIIIFMIILLYLYFAYLVGNIKDPNHREGETVVCDIMFPRSTVSGEVLYQEDTYIVVSGSATNYSFTGGTEIFTDCEGCSPGVHQVEVIGATKEVTTTYSDRYILKTHECVRQGGYKYKDIIQQVKMYQGE